jgi:P-type Na+/K+ transporter
LLPGDIIALKMGDTVPADVRLFEAMNLTLEEQSLTGEAAPVEKTTDNNIKVRGSDRLADDPSEVTIGDRTNIAYGTTTVLKGRGRGIVVSTGMETEVGKIAAATGKKPRKPGRSMNVKKYGLGKAILGFFKRSKDGLGAFLGLTVSCSRSSRARTLH